MTHISTTPDDTPAAFAWHRFSRRLPPGVTSVEQAVTSGLRTFEQWRRCLDTASRHAARVNSNARRRSAGFTRTSVSWNALRLLAQGESLTAEELSRQLGGPHVDVVRRAMKTFRKRGVVTASEVYTRDGPRRFAITDLGRQVLSRLDGDR